MKVLAPLHRWVAEPPPREVAEALERLRRGEDVAHIAVMPDVHLAEEVCVGTVLATHNTIVPAAVGGDIGCGMAALALDASADRLAAAADAAAVLDGLKRAIPALRHPGALGEHALPDALGGPLSCPALESLRRRTAGAQLGTLGRGNHFVELQADEDERLWLMVHSGSRGLGPAIRDHHQAGATRMSGGLHGLAAETPAAAAYLGDMQWALDYAELSRTRLLERACEVLAARLGVKPGSEARISCHHNFVRREQHGGAWLWVHRKGAISAMLDEPGVIPGSMGAPSYHVLGRGHPASLCSSSHGAGRCMARGEARRRIAAQELLAQLRGVWFDHRAAEALRDEAPAAYKDIGAVMRAQRELTRVVRRLRPVLSYKAAG
jgi:tRNA-splicing ligase RtcB